jgi:periodic tryptophan protein 2
VVYKKGDIAFSADDSVVVPVGSRLTRYDIQGSDGASRTSEWEAIDSADFERVAVSPDGRLVLGVDEGGRAVLATVGSQHVLGRLNLAGPVSVAAFSPDGSRVALGVGRLVQVWRVPSAGRREWLAFELLHTLSAAGTADTVTALAWSPCGMFIATGSPDMAVRVLQLRKTERTLRAIEATGHRHTIVGVHWTGERLWSVSREGVIKAWSLDAAAESLTLIESAQLRLVPEEDIRAEDTSGSLFKNKKVHESPVESRPWISSVAFRSNLVLCGFINGAFGLFSLDPSPAQEGVFKITQSVELLYALSIGQHKIDACSLSTTGEWLAFASSTLGQLLVWEWRSESYVLKQQGHVAPLTAVAFSPDGQSFATGGQDGRVKIWSVQSGFAHVTFQEHRGAITALEYVKRGSGTRAGSSAVLLSASTDGTVRAWDLLRCKPFRILATPTPVQFSCLAVDPSGDVVVAGTLDTFQIYVWSLQTGDLIETIEGHSGPISCLAFDPIGTRLASGSWDRSVRFWNLFARDRQPEDPLTHQHDVLSLAFRPDGKELVVATLGGELALWDTELSSQVGSIEARRDIAEGRLDGVSFATVAYSVDGRSIWASGSFPWIAIYSAERPHRLLLKRLPLSIMHDSKDKRQIRGERLQDDRDHRRILALSPTGRNVALLTEDGCRLWGQDEGLLFDPVDLDPDCTPESTLSALKAGDHLRALLMAFRLGIPSLTLQVWLGIPHTILPVMVPQLPLRHLPALMALLASLLSSQAAAHLELALRWLTLTLQHHGLYLKSCNRTVTGLAASLRAIHKACHQARTEFGQLANDNLYSIKTLTF